MTSLEINKIHCIDCVQGMNVMEPQTVDVIVTSPPYNIGIEYNKYNDKKSREEYLNWLKQVAIACRRVMKEDGSYFLNVGGSLNDPWIPMDVAQVFREFFVMQNMIHWINSIAILKEDIGVSAKIKDDIAVGHYKPINSKRYHHDCHEFIFHFTKNGSVELDKLSIGVPYQDKTNINRWKSAAATDKRDRGNNWFIPYPTIRESRDHPASFPVKLPEMCIKDHGLNKTNLVLDPFMGSGNTGIACRKLGVNYIGFEIDQYYCKMAEERIKETNADICKTKSVCALSSFL